MKYQIAMNPPIQTLARRTPLVLAALVVTAVLGFAAVSRLVTRLKANEKRIAYHAFEAGMAAYQGNDPDRALDDFRAALSYDRDNSTYQLSLARALRDTGRLDESKAYLVHLWEGAPQDSTINIALARLAARRHSVDDAIRYYHNAIYGVWGSDPDRNRRQTRFELIDFLLQQKAFPQAQAELVALTQVLPPDSSVHLAVANRFREAQDLPSALTQYEVTLKLDHRNLEALAGAGQVAFQLGRYSTAQKYLRRVVELNPKDDESRQQLESASLVLTTDPFVRHISDAERNRRLVSAFTHAGERVRRCAEQLQIALPSALPMHRAQSPAAAPAPGSLPDLWSRWNSARPDLRRLSSASNTDLPDVLMDLVIQIEQQTAQQCGPPGGADLALLLISRDREDADQ
jgi:tetratricopeptide (TPR) repeat protein